MSRGRKRGSARGARESSSQQIELNMDEVALLVRIADYHLKSMGLMRYLVRLTASGEVRSKYRFVAEESRWLKRFAETVRDDMEAGGQDSAPVEFTPRSLVAFWGRLLASLNSRRSRRRLSAEEIRRREELAARLEEVARLLWLRYPGRLEDELGTRRPAEAGWMRSKLEGG